MKTRKVIGCVAVVLVLVLGAVMFVFSRTTDFSKLPMAYMQDDALPYTLDLEGKRYVEDANFTVPREAAGEFTANITLLKGPSGESEYSEFLKVRTVQGESKDDCVIVDNISWGASMMTSGGYTLYIATDSSRLDPQLFSVESFELLAYVGEGGSLQISDEEAIQKLLDYWDVPTVPFTVRASDFERSYPVTLYFSDHKSLHYGLYYYQIEGGRGMLKMDGDLDSTSPEQQIYEARGVEASEFFAPYVAELRELGGDRMG
jgi:hypothetical protein